MRRVLSVAILGAAVFVGTLITPGARASAEKAADSKKSPPLTFAGSGAAPSVPGHWVSIGPSRISEPDRGFGQYNAVGRLTTVAVHPSNPQIIYVGSPGASGHEGSGVWKTTNGGTSWTPITDSLPSLAVDAIAIDPTNPDRV